MNDRTFRKDNFTFKRVNKKDARKAYKNGLTVVICPCNLRPFTMYQFEIDINNKNHHNFDDLIIRFEAYNCINSETGLYTAYYIPVKTIDTFTGENPTKETINTVESYDYDYIGV